MCWSTAAWSFPWARSPPLQISNRLNFTLACLRPSHGLIPSFLYSFLVASPWLASSVSLPSLFLSPFLYWSGGFFRLSIPSVVVPFHGSWPPAFLSSVWCLLLFCFLFGVFCPPSQHFRVEYLCFPSHSCSSTWLILNSHSLGSWRFTFLLAWR